MVEQEAVNFEVAGSSPAPGAILDDKSIFYALCFWFGGDYFQKYWQV